MGQVVDGTAGAANSKSSSATAMPSRKTTFSGHTSLWHTSDPPAGSASASSQVIPRGSNPRAASCSPRSSLAMDASAASDWLQSG